MDSGVGTDWGGGALDGGRQREKNWDNCNSLNKKMFLKRKIIISSFTPSKSVFPFNGYPISNILASTFFFIYLLKILKNTEFKLFDYYSRKEVSIGGLTGWVGVRQGRAMGEKAGQL